MHQFPERLHLVLLVLNASEGSETTLGNCRSAGYLGHGEDVVLNFWGEIEEREDLCDPSSGEAFLSGDSGLVGNLAGVQ